MKKFIFIFSFLIGSMSMFANELVTEKEVINELIEIEIPIKIDAPDETYTLLSVITAEEPMGILQSLVELINKLGGTILNDTIELDVLGIPGGIMILTTNVDIALWEVTLNEIAFNAILGDEGVTGSAKWTIIPGILAVNFVISVY